MIDKKFLSKVLDKKITTIKSVSENGVHYKYSNNGTGKTDSLMRMNDLAHKCKEWAILDGYSLSSYPVKKYKEPVIEKWICQVLFFGAPLFFLEDSSESKVIIKSCQVIIDKDKK